MPVHYDNIVVLSQNDALLFRCNQRKANWYVGKGLAEVVKESPKTLKLKFITSGGDHDRHPYFIQKFENQCVVCGDKTSELHNLSLIPICYRMPKAIVEPLNHLIAHDKQQICTSCQREYLPAVEQRKKFLAALAGVSYSGIWFLPTLDVPAVAALVKYDERIPTTRKNLLLNRIKDCLGYQPSVDEMKHIFNLYVKKGRKPDVKSSQVVVQQKIKSAEEYDDFCIGWRKYFIEKMNPRFMPKHWDPEFKMAQDFFKGKIR